MSVCPEPIDPGLVALSGIRIVGIRHGVDRYQRAVSLFGTLAGSLDRLIDSVVPLDDVGGAFDLLAGARERPKVGAEIAAQVTERCFFLLEAPVLRVGGDAIAVNDIVAEIETAKSLVELPSPFAGSVAALHAAEGDTVPVGAVLVSVSSELPAGTETRRPAEPVRNDADGPDEPAPAVLVGYGPRASRRGRRRRVSAAATSAVNGTAPVAEAATAGAGSGRQRAVSRPLATPPIRKLAKDLGVDLAAVAPANPGGRITRADLERHTGAGRGPVAPEAGQAVHRIPVRGVRRATAAAMTRSAFTAPQASERLTVDMSRALEVIGRLRADRRFTGLRVTPLLLVCRALCAALRDHPELNSTWDEDAGEISVYERVGLGIAASTERGLLVPVVRDADRLDLPGLAAATGGAVESARAGRATPEDLTGGTVTVTNVGVFGVDGATAILTPGQAAILCMGAVRPTAWVDGDEIVARPAMELSLSFDHRIIDGELAARALTRIAAVLADPLWELALT